MELRGNYTEKIKSHLIAGLASDEKFSEFQKLIDHQITAIRASFKIIESDEDIRYHNALCAEMEALIFIKAMPQMFKDSEDTQRTMEQSGKFSKAQTA